ncbi:MAG TPA: sigma-70 family RNA polymerase sigma factor [Chloroflexota bacterium]|nr:sigma-70 family RNA polymerase sigma factor [Chloroflexota bacterium]
MMPSATPTITAAAADEQALVAALRQGDEAAFEALVDRYHTTLVAVAIHYVRDRAVAEEVAQETWLGLLKGIDRFEGRASLKSWLFQILVNRAKSRGVRESRSVPLSALQDPDVDGADPAVAPARFLPADHPRWPGHWATPPQRWDLEPEASLLSGELRGWIEQAIAALPESQRLIITLRDVQGWSPEEVCESLGLSDGNQRVLLHRARSRVRTALEAYVSPRAELGIA